MEISIVLLMGVLVFTINHLLEFLTVKALIFLRFWKFRALYWAPQSITLLASIGFFNWLYYYFNEYQARMVIWVAVAAYLSTWIWILVHSVIGWIKSRVKPSMRKLIIRMLIGIGHYAAACFSAMYVDQIRFKDMFSGMNQYSDLDGLAYGFFLVCCVVAAIYLVSGLGMIVYASRSPKYKSRLYLGVLFLVGCMLLVAGSVMGGFLLYGPKSLAGIVMIVCGAILLLVNVLVADRENTHMAHGKIRDSNGPDTVLTAISLGTIIPGVGLMISGLA